ncbi:dr1-associated corepressor-like isoform X4 [Daktulosphaira vitifoliae]|uniref:dr1-associated corepressor-like isoform X4 n=1 Tax=Daktulosphaira vitifoliae TaxID=58002 RepID=UPI0021A9DA9F|nr:dr1-associated corepressor-like isoform X4 [Daktulosphaira vitifoliae]
MPSKKRKYNSRFPAGRIKKIMRIDDDIGKVALPVPVMISRALELFVASLLNKAGDITMQRNAKTLTLTHLKQCILSDSRLEFLRELVKDIPDVSEEHNDGNSIDGVVVKKQKINDSDSDEILCN